MATEAASLLERRPIGMVVCYKSGSSWYDSAVLLSVAGVIEPTWTRGKHRR